MTDRLSALMRQEADALDVPPPAAAPALSQGRGIRRRRRVGMAVAGVAVLAAVASGAALIDGFGNDRSAAPAPAATDRAATGAAFAIGTTVYFDDATKKAQIDDNAIKSLYYTSAGVLVRHGDNPSSDGGGPQRFSLVEPDATVTTLSVVTEEAVASTDVAQPYLAYAEVTAGNIEVVVHDVATDSDVARVALPAGDGSFLPVSIDGDLVYVSAGSKDYVVDWRTGEVTEPNVLRGYPTVHGGRSAIYGGTSGADVLDAVTGEVLLNEFVGDYGFFSLSLDGDFAQVVSDEPAKAFDVYDIDAGTHVSIPGQSSDFSWTPGGDLYRLADSMLTTCEADTGDCTSVPVALDVQPNTSQDPNDFSGELKLGGRTYES